MSERKDRGWMAMLVMALLVGGCQSVIVERTLGPATDTPERFLVQEPASGVQRPARVGEGCRNPLIDPRDGSLLVLVRSLEGRGDYAVPAGRYGVGPGQLLRVRCADGVALARVRR